MLAATVHSLRSKYRATLLEAYTAYCAHEPSLPLSGFLTFADSFDISSYLSAERVADIFEQVISTPARRGGKGSISFEEFKEAICLCALAVSDKQWQARPPAPAAPPCRSYRCSHHCSPPAGRVLRRKARTLPVQACRRRQVACRAPTRAGELSHRLRLHAPHRHTAAPPHPGRALIAVFSLNRRSSSCSRR